MQVLSSGYNCTHFLPGDRSRRITFELSSSLCLGFYHCVRPSIAGSFFPHICREHVFMVCNKFCMQFCLSDRIQWVTLSPIRPFSFVFLRGKCLKPNVLHVACRISCRVSVSGITRAQGSSLGASTRTSEISPKKRFRIHALAGFF
jgi:hypothetical protein